MTKPNSKFPKRFCGKLGRMEIFRKINRSLSELGLGPNQHPFNEVQIKFILKAILLDTLLCIHLFHGDKTYKQYMDSIFMTSEGTLFFIAFLSSIFQMANLSLYINMLDEIVAKREINPTLNYKDLARRFASKSAISRHIYLCVQVLCLQSLTCTSSRQFEQCKNL